MIRNKHFATIAVVLGWGAALGAATDYTFRVTDGKWNVQDNWNPPIGIPGELDSATILTDQTCRIEDRDESINTLRVDGTLRLMNQRSLTMGGPVNSCDIILQGLIKAEGQARLLVKAVVFVYGSPAGVISATGEGNHLEISTAPGQPSVAGLSLAGPTVKGNVSFLVHIFNDGQITVDAPADVMDIGYKDMENGRIRLTYGAQGRFRATAGQMLFWYAEPDHLESEWRIEGGTLRLTELATSPNWFSSDHMRMPVKLRSGSLEFGIAMTRFFAGLEFTGGAIKVAPACSVSFTKSP